ncbi:hypothetical protein QR680_005023 [Steinernema hermaphroditum]|uniref:Uncharacterized protein n=1 Tax=Steinernema hermaphroditum TaxID=289476 RepID=A0AA39HSW2_9BILA|nr:hypothetical protein QR680_005023 [Steinernema hermaphroditum]
MTEKAKVRSAEEEEALDRRIAEIRRKNEALERRQKEVEEDRARAQPQRKQSATEHASAVLGDEKKSQHQKVRRLALNEVNWGRLKGESPLRSKKESVKHSNYKGITDWSREWDHGKTSADTWIVNVPEMGHETMSAFNRASAARGGRGGHRGGRGGGPAHVSNGSRRSTGGESSKSRRSQHDDRSTPPRKESAGGLSGRLTRVDAAGKKEAVSLAQIQDKNHNNPKRPNLNTRGGHESGVRNGRGGTRGARGGTQGRPEAAREPKAKTASNFPKQNGPNSKRQNNIRGGPRNQQNSDAKVIRSVVDDLVKKATQLALSGESKP